MPFLCHLGGSLLQSTALTSELSTAEKLSFHRAKSSGPKIFPKFWALNIYFLCITFVFNSFPTIILAPLFFLYHIRSPVLYDPQRVRSNFLYISFFIFLLSFSFLIYFFLICFIFLVYFFIFIHFNLLKCFFAFILGNYFLNLELFVGYFLWIRYLKKSN